MHLLALDKLGPDFFSTITIMFVNIFITSVIAVWFNNNVKIKEVDPFFVGIIGAISFIIPAFLFQYILKAIFHFKITGMLLVNIAFGLIGVLLVYKLSGAQRVVKDEED